MWIEISALFGFDYTWEIYTPADRKQNILTVKNIWYEDGVRNTKKLQAAVDRCLGLLAEFNECGVVRMQDD